MTTKTTMKTTPSAVSDAMKRVSVKDAEARAAREAAPDEIVPMKAATTPAPAKGGKKAEAGPKAKPNATRANDGPRAKNEKAPRPAKKPSGLDLAAKVLADAGEPLAVKAIAERAIAAGWVTNGKTPHLTLYAAIVREISKKGDAARFKKTDRGLFVAGKGA